MELTEYLDLANHTLQELFGQGYDKKPVHTIHRESKRKARAIIRSLKPFAKSSVETSSKKPFTKEVFPERYNPRAVHALFALAFLFYSPVFYKFIQVVRLKAEPKTSEPNDASEFVDFMLETIRFYQYMAQYTEGTIRLYDGMNPNFKKTHAALNMPAIVQDQLVVVIDFTNPIEHIKAELESLLKELQHNFDEMARDQITEMTDGSPEFLDKVLPSRHAAPVKDEIDNPKKYLPMWYQALMAYRMRLLKHKERTRIRIVALLSKAIDTTNESGDVTTNNRLKLAERLIYSAYHRIPMTTFHTKSSCL